MIHDTVHVHIMPGKVLHNPLKVYSIYIQTRDTHQKGLTFFAGSGATEEVVVVVVVVWSLAVVERRRWPSWGRPVIPGKRVIVLCIFIYSTI